MHFRLALPSVGNPPCQCSQQTSVPTHNPHGVVLDCHRARLACGRSSMCYSLLFGLSPPHTHARDTIRIICERTVMLTIRPTDMPAPAKQFLSSNTHLPVVMFQVLSPIPVTVVIPRCCHRYHDDFASNLRTQVAGSNIAAAIPTALCRQPTTTGYGPIYASSHSLTRMSAAAEHARATVHGHARCQGAEHGRGQDVSRSGV